MNELDLRVYFQQNIQKIADLYAEKRKQIGPGRLADLRHCRMFLCGDVVDITEKLMKDDGYQCEIVTRYFHDDWQKFCNGKDFSPDVVDHAFLLHEHNLRTRIIIDPTYLQFFPCSWSEGLDDEIESVMVCDLRKLNDYLDSTIKVMIRNHPNWLFKEKGRDDLMKLYSAIWDIDARD